MKLKKPNAITVPRNKRTQRPLKLKQAEDPELEEEANIADIDTYKLKKDSNDDEWEEGTMAGCDDDGTSPVDLDDST